MDYAISQFSHSPTPTAFTCMDYKSVCVDILKVKLCICVKLKKHCFSGVKAQKGVDMVGGQSFMAQQLCSMFHSQHLSHSDKHMTATHTHTPNKRAEVEEKRMQQRQKTRTSLFTRGEE